MKIGNIELKNNVFLAPMAGVTDLAFRLICKDMGVGLVFSEMVSGKGIYYGDENSKELTAVDKRERPVAIQVFGSDPEIMSNIVENYLNNREDIDIIDLNMGCPAPKIVKNGDGSALMKNPKLAREVIKAMVQSSKKPITLKIRMGWDKNNINGIDIAKIAEEEGVKALTIHGRTREMYYSGKADWEFIRKVKNAIDIPVIGNGDIFQPKDGINMLESTGCDAIAVGRGCRGNPWIFRRIVDLQQGKKDIPPDVEEIINTAIKHLDLTCSLKGEATGVKEMRKHIAWYLKGMENSNDIKNQINTVNNKAEVEKILLEYLETLI